MSRLVRLFCAIGLAAVAAWVAPAASGLAATPAPTAIAPVVADALVAYGSNDGIWVANGNGTGAKRLVPNGADGLPLAWSADGSRLLYRHGFGFGLTDAAGSAPAEFDLACPPATGANGGLAACEADLRASLSPDGTRLAYSIWEGSFVMGSPVKSSVVVMDLETGRVSRVGSTESTISGTCGEDQAPHWSPDGRRLAFVRTTGSDGSSDCPEALLFVNVEAGDAQQILAPGQVTGTLDANWSPDGSRILISGFVPSLGRERGFGGDIYSIGLDGTDLHALTTDGLSGSPSWTRDGRIAFTRWTGAGDTDPGDVWVMDADGGNARKVESTLSALTAAGCLTCPYPYNAEIDRVTAPDSPQLRRFEMMQLLWQP